MNYNLGTILYYLLRVMIAIGVSIGLAALVISKLGSNIPIIFIASIVGLVIGWWATSKSPNIS